ncbi:MAG: EamA family transporter [Vicingaceae bacterium]
MIYLLLSILCSTAIFIIFKAFEKYKVDNFSAIVINYVIATLTGFLAVDKIPSISEVAASPWFVNSLILGFFFIVLFNIMAVTAQKLGPSVASVANKMALIIPVMFAVFYYNDTLTTFKLLGVLFALVGIYLTTLKPKAIKKKFNWGLLMIPLVLFLGSGFIDTFIKFNQEMHLNDNTNASKLFSSMIFLTAFTLGVIALIFRKKNTFSNATIIGGLVLGFVNYGSIYFIIQAFNVSNLESSVVFPLNNMGVVILTCLASFSLFKEKFSPMNKLGIAFSILAILLISFSK